MRLIWVSLFYSCHIGAMPLFQMKANLFPVRLRLRHEGARGQVLKYHMPKNQSRVHSLQPVSRKA